jgi:hypothetical protein
MEKGPSDVIFVAYDSSEACELVMRHLLGPLLVVRKVPALSL